MRIRSRTCAGGGAAVVALLVSLAAASPARSTMPGRDGLIAYVSHSSGVSPGYGIVVVRADGSKRHHLTSDGRDRSPAWSPDGSKLVFERAGRQFVIRSDGTGLRAIAPRLNRAHQPAWSPDGRSITFVRGRTIYVMRSDGRGIHRLFERADAFVNRPSWSPDGSWIAFGLMAENDGGGSIVVVPRSGGAARYITDGRASDPQATLGDPDDYEPDWSPDGTRLAFTRIVWLTGYNDQQEIYSVRADGSDTQWITTDTSYEADRPAWSPSGGRIVAERASPGGVAIFTATGRLLRVLDPLGTEPAWQPLK